MADTVVINGMIWMDHIWKKMIYGREYITYGDRLASAWSDKAIEVVSSKSIAFGFFKYWNSEGKDLLIDEYRKKKGKEPSQDIVNNMEKDFAAVLELLGNKDYTCWIDPINDYSSYPNYTHPDDIAAEKANADFIVITRDICEKNNWQKQGRKYYVSPYAGVSCIGPEEFLRIISY